MILSGLFTVIVDILKCIYYVIKLIVWLYQKIFGSRKGSERPKQTNDEILLMIYEARKLNRPIMINMQD